MNFILKLYYGQYRLVKTYWIFNVIPSFFFGLLFGLMSLKSFPQDNPFLYLSILVFVLSYIIISTVGLWRSSSYYEGNIVWKVLSKIIVIFNIIFFGSVIYILLSSNIDLVHKVSLSLSLFLLILILETNKPSKNTESSSLYNTSSNWNSSSHTTTSQSKSNQISDDVWEKTLIEFESNRKQGLWGRLFAENNGDENLAKAKYLNLRAKEIHDNSVKLNLEGTIKSENVSPKNSTENKFYVSTDQIINNINMGGKKRWDDNIGFWIGVFLLVWFITICVDKLIKILKVV